MTSKAKAIKERCSVMCNSATPWTVAHRAPLSMGSQRVGCDLVTEQACQGRRDEGGARQGWKERREEREVWRHYVRSYIHSSLFLAFPPAL